MLLVVGTVGDLVADLLDEGVELHGEGLALAVADRDVAGLGLLGAQHQHIGHAVHLLGLADLVADLLVVAVQDDETGSTLTWVGASQVGKRPLVSSIR